MFLHLLLQRAGYGDDAGCCVAGFHVRFRVMHASVMTFDLLRFANGCDWILHVSSEN